MPGWVVPLVHCHVTSVAWAPVPGWSVSSVHSSFQSPEAKRQFLPQNGREEVMAHVRDKNAHPTITLSQLAFLPSVPPSDSQGLWFEILENPGTRLPKHLHLDWSPYPAMEVHVLVDTGVHMCACVCSDSWSWGGGLRLLLAPASFPHQHPYCWAGSRGKGRGPSSAQLRVPERRRGLLPGSSVASSAEDIRRAWSLMLLSGGRMRRPTHLGSWDSIESSP